MPELPAILCIDQFSSFATLDGCPTRVDDMMSIPRPVSALTRAGSVTIALLIAAPLAAQESRVADPADVVSIDAIIAAYYEVVSGRAGAAPDIERDRTLHRPGARVAITGVDGSGTPTIFAGTLEDYYDRVGRAPRVQGFFEREIDRQIQRFGNIAHVWSTYEYRVQEDGPVSGRGINSIQLWHDGSRWWITGWFFDSERAGNPLPGGVSAEGALAEALEQPSLLYPFLRAMPKGGDLHSHLTGAIYAESLIAWAVQDGLCLNHSTLTLSQPPSPGSCTSVGLASADEASQDPALYNQLVDAFSTRDYDPDVENGHNRFFDTFARFSAATQGRLGDMLAEVQARAADGNVLYLELMESIEIGGAMALGAEVGWTDDLDAMRERLLAAGVEGVAASASVVLDEMEARRDELLRCTDRVDAAKGCDVAVRYLYQVLRAFPREMVFAAILTGFELAERDDRVVGINLVQPEDDPVAMADYGLHMRIIQSLRPHYPGVKVSLHAGELAPGLVPTEGLRSHIREAVEIAGAERIGHGVGILHEDDALELMEAMARDGVMVEINLTSNDVILGVSGGAHPLRTWIDMSVPVALSTDDEGVSRSEMTLEYVRAVQDQNLGVGELILMARNSLEYAFIEGESLWVGIPSGAEGPQRWTRAKPCDDAEGGLGSNPCLAFLGTSPKAALQAEFERRLAAWIENPFGR